MKYIFFIREKSRIPIPYLPFLVTIIVLLMLRVIRISYKRRI